MIVHMTGLYTRLVTYARLHILAFVVSFYHDICYISFMAFFLILISLLSLISFYHVFSIDFTNGGNLQKRVEELNYK